MLVEFEEYRFQIHVVKVPCVKEHCIRIQCSALLAEKATVQMFQGRVSISSRQNVNNCDHYHSKLPQKVDGSTLQSHAFQVGGAVTSQSHSVCVPELLVLSWLCVCLFFWHLVGVARKRLGSCEF